MKNFLLVILFSLLLTACMSAALPQQQLYTLNPGTLGITKSRATAKTLLVLDTTSVPAFRRKDMAYVLGNYKIAYYSKNRWVVAPAEQLTPLIVSALHQSGHYRGVVIAPFIGSTDLRLATQLITLEQIFANGHSRVLMRLNAQLTNVNSGKLIAAKQLQAQVLAPQNNPYGGVVAANKATKIIIQQLVRFCVNNS